MSSLSDPSRSATEDHLQELWVDLAESSLLGGLAQSALRGAAGDVLAPLSVVRPGDASRVPAPSVDRSEIAAALRADNAARGHRHADAFAEKLVQPRCRVVATGQQVGLFGGPLFTFTKALGASLWARHLEEITGDPAVAVFWMAGEDHDYAEVAQAHLPCLPDPKIRLADDPQPLVPVGRRLLEGGFAETLAPWAARLEHRPAAAARLEQLLQWYAPGGTWSDAFAQLLIAALGDHCPLLLDAQLPRLKELQVPWHQTLVERREEIDATLDAARARVEAAGFSPRTRRVAGESPLFALDAVGCRRRVCFSGDGFQLRGGDETGTVEELLLQIAEQPERFGPGALARALIQDALLGTSVQVLGPGEVAYMAEAAPLYDLLEVQAPCIAQRPQAALVAPKPGARLGELAAEGLAPSLLMGPEAELEAALAARGGSDPVDDVKPAVDEALAQLRRACLELDPQLEKPLDKTCSAMTGALERLRAKATASRARKDEVVAQRARGCRDLLLPGAPQDRVITAAHFYVEVDDLGDWFAKALDLDGGRLQILELPA